jgi:hypothetical protein
MTLFDNKQKNKQKNKIKKKEKTPKSFQCGAYGVNRHKYKQIRNPQLGNKYSLLVY